MLTTQKIEEILQCMVFENDVVEVTITGFGEFYSIPIGAVCYRPTTETKNGASMASIPHGSVLK